MRLIRMPLGRRTFLMSPDVGEKLWIRAGVMEDDNGMMAVPGAATGAAAGHGSGGGASSDTGKGGGGMPPGSGMPTETGGAASDASGKEEMPMMVMKKDIPVIDTAKCVYPKCTACMDNCIVGAIDLSKNAPGVLVSGAAIFIQGCVHCGFPLCQRSCEHDAIIYEGERHQYSFNMKKCTFPKCTLCIGTCPMKSIDFSTGTPFRHNTCEGCDLCWSICPEDAIELYNFHDMMGAKALIKKLTELKPSMPKFRPLIPDGE